jgi:hypothetical protein
MAGPVPRIRNSGGRLEREQRLEMLDRQLGERGRRPAAARSGVSSSAR